jgi:hypothetical protein
MILYALILVIILILKSLSQKRIIQNNQLVRANRKVYIYIISIILITILGLRNITVGIDTFNYYNQFNSIKLFDLTQTLDVKVEQGYRLIQFIIGRLFGDFQFLLIIVAIIYISVVSYYIYKYSENPMLSYILFIVFDFYTFAMSAIRQTIAIAIIMIAFHYIKEKKLFIFLLLVFVASLFHITSLIFLPCYWFNKFKINMKTILFFILAGSILIIFRNYIQLLLNNYARIEYATSETGGYKIYILMFVTTFLGIFYMKPFINEKEINKYLLFMMIASVIIFPLIKFNPVMMRLYYYFFIFMIIYIPNILKVIEDKFIRVIGGGLYVLIGAIWFFTSVIPTEHLESYLFFWQ